MEKERNCHLMLYEFKCGHSAATATRNICRIEGAGTVKESTCRRWFVKFLNGQEGLKIRRIVRDERTHLLSLWN
jgi:hypothetical protein